MIHETLLRSQEISRACQGKFAIVSYDLLIAKVAKQIQATESPKFDNVFIQFGQFHTEYNIFRHSGR